MVSPIVTAHNCVQHIHTQISLEAIFCARIRITLLLVIKHTAYKDLQLTDAQRITTEHKKKKKMGETFNKNSGEKKGGKKR